MCYRFVVCLFLFCAFAPSALADIITPPALPQQKIADTLRRSFDGYDSFIFSGSQYKRLKLRPDQNAHITLDGFSGKAFVTGGRHVAFTGNAATSQKAEKFGGKRAVLRIKNAAHIYGYDFSIDAGQARGLDALIVGNDYGSAPSVTLENFTLEGGWNKWPYEMPEDTFHGDAFQAYGEVGDVVLRNGTIIANYQGLFLDPQHPIGSYTLENIDIRYGDRQTGYALFLAVDGREPPYPLTVLKDVRIWPGEKKGRPEATMVAPAKHWRGGCVREGKTIRFPMQPNIRGYVEIMD